MPETIKTGGIIMLSIKSVSLTALVAFTFFSGANAAGRPLKVYILVGQSNMQGMAKAATLPHMAEDPASKALHDKFVDESGKPKVYNEVQVAAFSQSGGWGKTPVDKQKQGPLAIGFGADLTTEDRFGPELGFGVTMYGKLKEPILIIKTAWGGKSLHTDFRPPSAGPYKFLKEVVDRKTHKGQIITAKEQLDKKVKATGHYYRLMAEVKQVLADPGRYHPAYDPQQGYEIAGFVWFQGFNDMVSGDAYPEREQPGGYDLYSTLLADFIRDVRKEFNAPKMPFVIGVIGVGGNPDKPNIFREAMAAPAGLPEFKGNVAAVETARYWDAQLDELDGRKNRWTGKRNSDPENIYADLREKLTPLQKELDEEKKVFDAARKKVGELRAGPKENQQKYELKAADKTLSDARKRVGEIEAKMKEIMYTPEELRILSIGKGSQGYHYLGSAKIYGRIGEAFADAMATLHGGSR
jgi:alpha-galactosidase